MAFIPLLIAVLLFLNKNNNSSFINILKNIDLPALIDILKEFNIGGDYLTYLTPETINSLLNGDINLKSLLPLAIRFFANKNSGEKHPNPPIKTDFMDSDIKTALFNYLKTE